VRSNRIRLRGVARVCVLLVLVFLPSAVRAAAQSYGLGDQVLTLGAAAFHPFVYNYQFNYSLVDGYVYGLDGTGEYTALLTLPDGAEIFQLCLYANVPNASSSVSLRLEVSKLVPGGQSPSYDLVDASYILDNIPIGYGTVCTDPFSYVFHDLEDVDSDGVPDSIAHLFRVGIVEPAGFGGVRIFWRRQVSPPPNAPSFNDVPTDDPYFQYVEALVASGITAGCSTNPPLYCPDAPLTRRQMAVFLSKALGLHWPN
jgi:S-layer homology domain